MTPQADNVEHTAKRSEEQDTTLPLGQYLRGERIKRDISIEEMQKRTSIHLKVLHAMEGDDPTNLPAPIFVRNFIKFYAETLGLDPQYALGLYNDKTGISPNTKTVATSTQELLESETLAESSPFISFSNIFRILLVTLVLTAAAFFSWRIYQSITTPQESAKKSVSDAPTNEQQDSKQTADLPLTMADALKADVTSTDDTDVRPELTPTEGEQPEQVTSAVPLPQPLFTAPYELAVTFTELTWTRVELDDKPASEAFFPAGSSHTWHAADQARLLFGNTNGVTITVNGTETTAATAGGQVGRLQLP